MTTRPFKITIHMVASLDGFIAKHDDSMDWFNTQDHYEKGINITDKQKDDFLEAIDCYIMGARTYELALELSKNYGWPYGDTPTIVLSHHHQEAESPSVEFYSGELTRLLNEKLIPNYKNIWVVGGATVCDNFMQLHLADEIRLAILPILLGDGKPFFKENDKETPLHLKDVTAYQNGVVELVYEFGKC